MKLKPLLILPMLLLLMAAGCKKKSQTDIAPTATTGKDSLAIYIPNEFSTMNFRDTTSTWCYPRSRQSKHFIVFWAKQYGSNDPNSTKIPSQYRVDINDMLTKAESFYDLNINKLKFAEVGVGKSKLDNYKMMIFLYYEDQWRATGSGYDDMIGALWISPAAVKPVGPVIAHEIGHCFQYQVFCDLGGGHGFRYGFNGSPGNGFWEQTANWQAYQSYPSEVFGSANFPVYLENCHRHFNHEDYRYASYFLHYYWASKHGIDVIGKIWRQALEPEDPAQAYMRMMGLSNAQFNDELYDAATKFVTWDLDALRTLGQNYIGMQPYDFNKLSDGSFQVTYARCPESTGYNVIPLKVPAAGTVLTTNFTGMPNASGYNMVNASQAGWRYGYVALLNDGSRVYGNMSQGITNAVNFTVPANCGKIWFVVTGAPVNYSPHAWDSNNANDEQWPYKVKFTNTTLFNDTGFDPNATPQNTTITTEVKVPFDNVNYNSTNVTIDLQQLSQAFSLSQSQISALIGSTITFYGVESNGNLNSQTTANGYGHWFDKSGNVINWGDNAKVYSEMDATKIQFTIGLFPTHVAVNDQFTIRQALVYQYQSGKKVQATFVFNVKIQ